MSVTGYPETVDDEYPDTPPTEASTGPSEDKAGPSRNATRSKTEAPTRASASDSAHEAPATSDSGSEVSDADSSGDFLTTGDETYRNSSHQSLAPVRLTELPPGRSTGRPLGRRSLETRPSWPRKHSASGTQLADYMNAQRSRPSSVPRQPVGPTPKLSSNSEREEGSRIHTPRRHAGPKFSLSSDSEDDGPSPSSLDLPTIYLSPDEDVE